MRDLRSSRVFEMLDELQKSGVKAEVYEPMVPVEQLQKKGISTLNGGFQWSGSYDAIILAVPHREFLDQETKRYLNLFRKDNGQGVVVDVRGVLDEQTIEKAEVVYWRL
ncbi:MAG TPA: UDP binding domain-containing protein [Pyrinomonadaceae bacterium]|nr:UDP binding domain-containing protein [Pyrinomonadaceae bacterium]